MGKTVFSDGNPAQGILGTIVTAAFLNALQNHRHDGGNTDGSCPSNYAADTGAANAYAIALTPAVINIPVGIPIHFMASNANTGASTLAVNGLAPVAIKQPDGTDLPAGAILAGQMVTVMYTGAVFMLVSRSASTQAYAAFYKANALSPAFTKTGAGTISIKAGTSALVAGTMVNITTDTAVVMPTLTAGTDYAIYACTDGTVRADASFTAPTGYTTANSRLIGGFHYGLVAPGTTIASGSFSTAAPSYVWTQADVGLIAGINAWSIWDLKWRTKSTDLRAQKGFTYCPIRGSWMGIYIASTDTDTNGLSKAGTNIASGTVLPKIPAVRGGNGTATYSAPTWWDFAEIVGAYGARLPNEEEFQHFAYGVTENQSIDAVSSTYPTTQRNAGYTSLYGIEQATGHHWVWGSDSGGAIATAYTNSNGGRGQNYNNNSTKVILGGSRPDGANSGSRCSDWYFAPSYVSWSVGVRAACDHLMLL